MNNDREIVMETENTMLESIESKISSMTETVLINAASLSSQNINLKEVLYKIELAYIHEALEKAKGVVSHAAERLGMRRTTLIEKMRKYNIAKG